MSKKIKILNDGTCTICGLPDTLSSRMSRSGRCHCGDGDPVDTALEIGGNFDWISPAVWLIKDALFRSDDK